MDVAGVHPLRPRLESKGLDAVTRVGDDGWPWGGIGRSVRCARTSSFPPKALVVKMLRFYILLVAGVFLLVSFAFLDGWPFRGPAAPDEAGHESRTESGEIPGLSRSATVEDGPPQTEDEPAASDDEAPEPDRVVQSRKTLADAREAGPEPFRQALSKAMLDTDLPWNYRQTLFADLRAANQAAWFGPRPAFAHEKVTVKGGDNLTLIARRIRKQHGGNVSPALIRLANGLAGDMIRRGQSLRVPTGRLEVLVHKCDFRLFVLLDGDVLTHYPVGLGRDDSTPVGVFTITGKTKNPPWRMPDGRVVQYGDPEHTIGSRWMGFATEDVVTSYGIHGTVDADSIGKSESEGCIRLLREHVQALFDLVPEGCTVTVLR